MIEIIGENIVNKVEVCCVILVGFVIRGKKDDMNICSLNLFEKLELSYFKRSILKSPIKYAIFLFVNFSKNFA